VGSEPVNLRQQVAVIRRRWRVVVLFTLLGVAVALLVSLVQSPTYSSSTSLALTPVNAAQSPTNGLVMQPTEIATQVQVLLSTPVAQRVIDTLQLDTSTTSLLNSVTVAQESDTRVIIVTARRPTSAEARSVAAAFAQEYLAYSKEQATEQSRAALAVLAEEAQRVRDRLAQVQKQLPGATGTEATQLQSEQQALLVELTQILGDQATASVNSPGALGDGGQVLVEAPLPTSPASPKPLQAALLGGFLGLLLGVGMAFVRDHFDDGVRDEFRLRDAIAPRPVLGRIPHWANAKTGRLATVIDPASQVSEAYRALSTSIRFLLAVPRESTHGVSPAAERDRLTKAPAEPVARTRGRILLVTSPMESEGKTSLSSNLAVVAARFGLRVTLVDADLRNPQIGSVFGLGRPPGLSDLLASDDRLEDYMVEVEDMSVLPGGSLAPNPAELLASPRMRELLSTIAATADLVIVDSAPVNRVSDALELVATSDLVLLAARHGQTRLRSLEEAIEKIHQVGGEVSGAVYVDVPGRSGAEAYGYGYTEEQPPADAEPATPEPDATGPEAPATPTPAAATTPGTRSPAAPAVVVVPARAGVPKSKPGR
jgi:capsular exopolysaccharide synthesis family protein